MWHGAALFWWLEGEMFVMPEVAYLRRHCGSTLARDRTPLCFAKEPTPTWQIPELYSKSTHRSCLFECFPIQDFRP